MKSTVAALLQWFRDHVRPFLGKHEPPERLDEYEAEAQRLEELARSIDAESPVCFLGQSGVGKSTLINAVIAGKDLVLPSGGIGPLTAQALSVVHGERKTFTVEYHSPQKLNRLIFALEADLTRQEGDSAIKENDTDLDLDGETRDDVLLESDSHAEPTAATDRVTALRKQAALLVTGNQNSDQDTPYLCDALRAACGVRNRWKTTLNEEDKQQVADLQEALVYGKNKRPRRFDDYDPKRFADLLRIHAAGCLAPLIKSIRVEWPTPVLAGNIALVDLPGLGVAADVHAEHTISYIRERARGVILVVNRSGIMEAEANLLRNSGFLNRLLHASGDTGIASDPVDLSIAVVQLDGVAQTRWEEDRNRSANGKAAKRKADHFIEVCAEMRDLVRRQLRTQLEAVWKDHVSLSDAKRAVIESILGSVQVFPVCAPEYRKALAQDEDDRAFLKPEETGIQELIESLKELSARRAASKRGRLEEAQQRFFEQVCARLRLMGAQWKEETRAAEDIAALRDSIEAFLPPLRAEFQNRNGAYRQFLRGTVPEIIEGLVEKAKTRATGELDAYLDTLQGYHWKTLQATVRHEGIFLGSRVVNLPRDFALRFEEPIAEVWGKELLLRIRTETKEFAEAVAAILEQVVEWAHGQGDQVRTDALEALIQVVRVDARKAEAVGQDAVDELRERVKNELPQKIEDPIRKHCREFVLSNKHVGTGTKDRTMVLFRRLSRETVALAAGIAKQLLGDRCSEVEKEILAVFHNPATMLDDAVEAIASTEGARIAKDGAKKRLEVLGDLLQIRDMCPSPWKCDLT
jgi:GTP-binding protein EngB required for normal cell division